MSWIKTLSETYDNILSQKEKDLLPIAHSTQNSHIEITINSNREMINAEFVDKDEAVTLIPVTEDSASRGNGIIPHPLCDKLIYLAGDYNHYVDGKENKFYIEYMKQLKLWKDSDYSNEKIEIIYDYLNKQKLISDLINFKILFVDENNILLDKFQTDKKMTVGGQLDAFIRFRVVTDNLVDAVWEDDKLINDYVNYYTSKEKNRGFCYVEGEFIEITDKHPSKITYSGDKSKLISANDKKNFTFKGRFHTPEQAVTVGYLTSQKAHNALKWLIENQGKKVGSKTFVLWGIDNEKTPDYLADTVDFCLESLGIDERVDYTKKDLAKEFNKAIDGYKSELKPETKLALIGLEPPTTGRLSIIFYREYFGLQGNELINCIEKWHKETSWLHHYKFINKERYSFYGAPSTIEIVKCAFGTEQGEFIAADARVLANGVERMLPSIIEGRKIPRDIVLKLIERAKQPQNYKNIYNWYKVLTVASATYKKYLIDYEKEMYSMEVKETENLAYNCGRLLAIADAIESWSLRENAGNKSEVRTTNAIRYFTKFSILPASTWGIINDKLIPHKQRLGTKGTKLYKLLGEISSLIDPDDFKNAKNLDGSMVLGYDTQRQALFNKKEKENIEEEEE